jgi:hypothetical protein
MVFGSGCYIRTAVNNLQRFSTKPLLNFAALPITAVVQPLLTGGNNRCKSLYYGVVKVVKCLIVFSILFYIMNLLLKFTYNPL